MSLPRYPKYKDSGVEWLGQVPEGWGVVRLKFVATVQTGIAKGKDNSGKKTIELPYLRVANVQDGFLDLSDVATISIPSEDAERYLLQIGDVLMNEGGDFDKLGRGHVWRGEIEQCAHQNHVFAARPIAIQSDWLSLVTSSQYAQFYFMTRSKQSTNLASISSTNLMELPVVVPSPSEQHLIATFLDRETAKIDVLVSEQEKLITLLKEKRQAVISHAVTKGLDPTVPMKDSGVEWLGKVPEGWGIGRVKTVSKFITSGPRGWSERVGEEGALFVQSGDLNDFLEVVFAESRRVPVENDAEAARTMMCNGDVVVCITGAKTGNVAVCLTVPEPAFINQHLCLIRPSDDVLPLFLAVVLKSRVGQTHFELSQYGLKQGLSLEDVKEAILLLPPKYEQASLVAYVCAETSKLDTLITEAQRAIELLKERRSALISAAVTGQIDVRGVAKGEAP